MLIIKINESRPLPQVRGPVSKCLLFRLINISYLQFIFDVNTNTHTGDSAWRFVSSTVRFVVDVQNSFGGDKKEMKVSVIYAIKSAVSP